MKTLTWIGIITTGTFVLVLIEVIWWTIVGIGTWRCLKKVEE